jgi:cytochrome b-561 domain-containing protein 2
MVAHFVCVLFTGYIIYTAQPGSGIFSWHPTFMALSFMFLAAQGLLIFSPHSSLILSKPRKTKVTLHWVLMVLATVSALIGYGIIFYSKWERGKEHLTTWHGICGLAVVIYIVLQCCAGLNLLYPQVVLRVLRLVTVKRLHAASGLTLFMLAVTALLTGMYSKWFVATVTGSSWYTCAACPLLMLMIIASQIKNAYLSG